MIVGRFLTQSLKTFKPGGNKVIRPRSHASALSKKVRQTDKTFFKKTFEMAFYSLDGPMDGQMDQPKRATRQEFEHQV